MPKGKNLIFFLFLLPYKNALCSLDEFGLFTLLLSAAINCLIIHIAPFIALAHGFGSLLEFSTPITHHQNRQLLTELSYIGTLHSISLRPCLKPAFYVSGCFCASKHPQE